MKKHIVSILSVVCVIAYVSCVLTYALAEASPSPSAKSKGVTPDTTATERKDNEQKQTAKTKKDHQKVVPDPQRSA